MDVSLSKLQELMMDREAGMLQTMEWQRVGHDQVTELNWTETKTQKDCPISGSYITPYCAPPHSGYPHSSPGVCLCLVSDLLFFSLESIFIPFLSKCVFLLCSVLNKHCFSVCFPIHFAVSLINFLPVFTVFTSLKHSYFQKEEKARVSLVLASRPLSSCG